MALRPLISLMFWTVVSSQALDDYNVFVRALPPQQSAQQVYDPRPQQQQPYQQVRGPSQFHYQDTYPSQYYQDYHQPPAPVQQQRHLPQHPVPSSSSSQDEVDSFSYQQPYEPPSTTSTTSTTTTTATPEIPTNAAAVSSESSRAAEVQKSQMSVSSSVEGSDRQSKAQQTGGQKPVQVVQKTVTKDKDGKKEEYVIYYYYYYDDEKKNETVKEQPVDSLDSFDSDSKSKFQPRAQSLPPASSVTAMGAAAITKGATSALAVEPTRSPTGSSAASIAASGIRAADRIAAISGARLVPETNLQVASVPPSTTITSTTETTSTAAAATTTATTTSAALTATTEASSISTNASDDRRKGFGNRRKSQKQPGETNRRQSSTSSTTTSAPKKPLTSRKSRPSRPSRLNRRPSKPTTESTRDDDGNKDDLKGTVTLSPEVEKPGRKRFGSGPRARGPKRTTTAAPVGGDDSQTTATAAARKPLPTRGTAGGLFGKGQGIRGPRPRPGRRQVKKEEPEVTELPVEDKDKPTDASKSDEPLAKLDGAKVEETTVPTEGTFDGTTAAPTRIRQRQRGTLFAGGRPRPNLKRTTTVSDPIET